MVQGIKMPRNTTRACPVCRKLVKLELVRDYTYKVLFHNDQRGSPCNGVNRRGMMIPNTSKEEG